MIIQTSGFVLRQYPLRETSVIASLYTQDCGKIKVVAKGVRERKSKRMSHFDIGTLLDVTIYDKPNRELQLLSNSTILDTFEGSKNALQPYLHRAYIIELVDSLTQLNMPHLTLFKLLHAYFAGMTHTNWRTYTLAFEVKFLKLTGIFPNLTECSRCKKPLLAGGLFSHAYGTAVCDNNICGENFYHAEVITPDLINYIFLLIKKTFPEIMTMEHDTSMQEKAYFFIRSYINHITDNKLKTQNVIHEMSEKKKQG